MSNRPNRDISRYQKCRSAGRADAIPFFGTTDGLVSENQMAKRPSALFPTFFSYCCCLRLQRCQGRGVLGSRPCLSGVRSSAAPDAPRVAAARETGAQTLGCSDWAEPRLADATPHRVCCWPGPRCLSSRVEALLWRAVSQPRSEIPRPTEPDCGDLLWLPVHAGVLCPGPALPGADHC